MMKKSQVGRNVMEYISLELKNEIATQYLSTDNPVSGNGYWNGIPPNSIYNLGSSLVSQLYTVLEG